MHQHYADFMTELVKTLYKTFAPDKNESLARKRSSLRFILELFNYGGITDPKPMFKLVNYLVENFDTNPSDNLALLMSFAKYANKTILGYKHPKKPKVCASFSYQKCSILNQNS